jgi:putative hydrolase of the HAD superfamily
VSRSISTLFLDIGGILLTNGWDHTMRQKAAESFDLDYREMNERHHLTFSTYEQGKINLDEYLSRVVFHQERSFSRQDFKDFMYAQSKSRPEVIGLVRALKTRYPLRIAAISNEGRELTIYRIRKFALGDFMDFFVCSCFVHYRKPDEDIYRLALDIAQVEPENSLYIEDRPMFVEVARSLGINGIVHTDLENTRAALESFGFSV